MKNYGFNTFVTENWLPLAEVLIDSISSFSKYTITVNCINFTHDFKSDKVISKRVDIDKLNFYSVCMVKWMSLLETNYDICAILDADMIATKEVDDLFETNEQKVLDSKFPILAKHPHNPFENPIHKNNLKNLCSIFSEHTPKMKWVYACGLIANHHKWFISELVDNLKHFYKQNISTYIEDEGMLNALLTKYQVSENLGYNHIPYFTLKSAYIDNSLYNNLSLQESYLQYDCDVRFYLLHGCKNAKHAKDILSELKIKYNNEN